MFEEGDFEVVDECTGEEEPTAGAEDKPSETPKTDGKVSTNGKDAGVKKATGQTNQKPKDGSANGIDFTADISMDREENPKDDTMDDEVIQLDVGDLINLGEGEDKPDGDKPKGEEKNGENSEGKADKEAAPVVLPEHAWYEEKINAKTVTVRERLSKLARVLELSYPTYKPWLEHSKDPVCHLDAPRRCPLDRPHTNRWKFICSRKPVQESTNKEEDSAEGTVNKKVETVWRLGPTDGSGVNTHNASQYPPFVMRVVKVFEEFIQSVDRSNDPGCEEPIKEENVTEVKSEAPDTAASEDAAPKATTNDGAATEINAAGDETTEAKDKDEAKEDAANDDQGSDGDHNWLWLLVRCNSKDELMVFATGKKISHETMEKLKETFENGPGKDCNVKSLYCKSIAKVGNLTTTNITFLSGSEALDETVAGLKIQLAPKTNFWCNASGVETLGAAVGDMLSPMPKSSVVEVGCGLGLLGLMIAPKCRQVIGVDAPSEVEEAEMTSELNKIQNTTFVMGTSNEMMTKVAKLLKNTKASAIINANTKIGRSIEAMTALRKIRTLRRVVMITTLTKQSVRAILELTRPADGDLGDPFMPVRAVLVDTLPTGPHFEVVIRMERLIMQKMQEPWFWSYVDFRAGLAPHLQQQKKKNDKPAAGQKPKVQAKKTGVKGSPPTKPATGDKLANRRANNRANKRNKMKKQKAAGQGVVVGSRIVVGPGLVTGVVKNAPKTLVKNPLAAGTKPPVKNPVKNPGKVPPKGKRPHSPDRSQSSSAKKPVRNKPVTKGPQSSKMSPASPTPQQQANRNAKPNRPRLPPSLKKNPMARIPPRGGQGIGNAAQKRKRNWANEVSMMRGQPLPEKRMRENAHHPDLRARLSEGRMDPVLLAQVQEQQMLLNIAQQRLGGQGGQVDVDTAKQLHKVLNIVLEQTNKLQSQLPRSVWDRIAPPGNSGYSPPPHNMQRDPMMFRDRFVQDVGPQDILITTPNRKFDQPPNQGPMPLFPNNRPPLQPNQVMPSGISSLDIPSHSNSRGRPERAPPRDNHRDQQNHGNNWHRQNQYDKNRGGQQTMNKPPPLSSQLESEVRGSSSQRPLLSPPRRFMPSYPQQADGEMRRPPSPPRRQMSPVRRPITPPRRLMSPARVQESNEIFQRRPAALQGRQQQQHNVPDLQRRGISPPRQRDQAPAVRPVSPVRRFGDEWDIPNRGALEQGNWNQRQQQQQQQQRPSDRNAHRASNLPNWDHSTPNDRYRKNDGGKDGTWMGSGSDMWNTKSSSMKPGSKDLWLQGQNEKQWGSGGGGGGGGGGSSGDFWNIRGKDTYGQSNNRMDSRRDGNKDKEDWSDLPEDARDPWGDDGGQSSRPRWQQSDKASSSNWGRDNGKDKMDQNWSNKMTGNWQNKGMSMGGTSKPQWPSMGNQSSNDQRWNPLNDGPKKSLGSDNWPGNSNMNNWRPQQNFSGYSQQQRQNPFGLTNFKDGR